MYKTHLFLKFYVYCKRSSDIASFVKHSVRSIFKMYSLLVLHFTFGFATNHSKCFWKSHFFVKLKVLCERNSDIASFVERPLYSIFQMYSLLNLLFFFGFATIHPRCFCNSQLFFKFYLLRKRSSNISSFLEHPVFSNFRIYSFLILFFLILICHYLPKVYA